MLRGIDVSSIQGTVPWDKVVAAGCSFAIVKASTGNNRPGLDPNFQRNVDGARAAGLLVGCYNFVYPLPSEANNPLRDPDDQANYHFGLCKGYGSHDGELGPFVDAEWPEPTDWARWGCTAPQIRAWLHTYLDAVERLWGRTPTIYTYPDWAQHVDLAGDPAFARYPLWAASYHFPDRWPVAGEAPVSIAPWGASWAFWQATGGTMSLWGVPVDTDVFNGSLEDLRSLASPGQTAAIAHNAILQASDEIPEV